VKGDQLPAEHYVARHCRDKDLILTNGEPTGVNESAFDRSRMKATDCPRIGSNSLGTIVSTTLLAFAA
jgi:hypothetical protein